MEPWTRTTKVFEMFFLEKVTGKLLAKRKEEGKNLNKQKFFCKRLGAQGLQIDLCGSSQGFPKALGNWKEATPLSDPEVGGV